MKLLKSAFVLAFAFALTACGMGEQSAKEVIQQAAKASENMESMAMSMDMEQTIKMGERTMEATSHFDGTATTDPLAMHMNGKMGTNGQSANIEMYMTGSGMYMKDQNGEWMKFPSKMFGEMMKINEQTKPIEELKELKTFADDFSIEEKDGHYVLKLSTGGERFTDYVKDNMKSAMPEGSFDNKAFEKMTLNEVNYQFVLNKDTYYPTALEVKMDMSMESPTGKKLNLVQNISGTYSKYNKVEKIVVPDEIKNKAKEMPGM